MPPPKPSAEPRSDPRVRAEVDQLVRALRAEGATDVDGLALRVGAAYWEPGRFASALAAGVADGLLVRGPEGRLAAL